MPILLYVSSDLKKNIPKILLFTCRVTRGAPALARVARGLAGCDVGVNGVADRTAFMVLLSRASSSFPLTR